MVYLFDNFNNHFLFLVKPLKDRIKMTVKSNSTNKLKPIDFFGRKFKFNFSGNSPGFKTPLGGFFMILMVLIITPILVIFGRRWIDTSKPTVSVNSILKDRTEIYRLHEGNLFLGLLLFNGADFVPFDQIGRYTTLRAERVTRFEDPEGEVRDLHSPFPYVHCSKLTHNVTNELDKILGALNGTRLDVNAGLCPSFHLYDQWFIKGSMTQLPYTKIVYRMYPCSLENRAGCVGVDVLGGSQFIVPVLYNSMNFKNYSSPVTDGFDTDLTPLYSLSTQNKFIIWLKRNKIYDDRDSLRGGGPKFTFFNVDKISSTVGTRDLSTHCTEISIEDGSCLPYLTMELRVSSVETLIERRYYRIFSLVSDVGGMMDILFYVFAGIYALYVSRRYKNWVILQFYGPVVNTEELGILTHKKANPGSFRQIMPKRSSTIQTSQLLKNTKNRDLVLKRLMKKMDVMTYIKFSQKAFILTHLTPNDSYYEALTPIVYFNLSRKLRQRKYEQRLTNFINFIKNTEVIEAYKTLAKSRPKSQFEEKIKYMFMKIVERSGKIDRDTIAVMKVVPEADSVLESSIREEFEEEEEEKIENRNVLKIFSEQGKSINLGKKVVLGGKHKTKMIVKSSFRNRGTDQSFRFGRMGSRIQKMKKNFTKKGLFKK